MLFRRFLSVFFLCSLVLHGAGAEEVVLHERLPNGLNVVVREAYASPTVSVNVFIRAGSLHESTEATGLAHFYEHMFFRGTPSRNGLQFKKAIESLGGTTNATTSRDMTHFYINLPSAYAKEGLALLADAFKNAELATEGIDKEREVVLEEYRIGENNGARIVSDKLYAMAFPDHPYGRSVIGLKEHLEKMGRQSFVKWKSDFYVPQRTWVVVVGDVEAPLIMAQAKALFAGLKRAGQPRMDFPTPKPPAEKVYKTETGPVGRTFVLLGFLAPSVKEKPDIYAVDVLSFLMGQGKTSMLRRHLVDTEVANSASVEFLTQAHPGLFIMAGIGEPKKAEKIRDGMLEVVAKARQGEFTDEELDRAKTRLLRSYQFGRERNSGKADNLGFYAIIDDMEFALTYAERVAQVNREAVIAAAKKYLIDQHYGLTMKPQ